MLIDGLLKRGRSLKFYIRPYDSIEDLLGEHLLQLGERLATDLIARIEVGYDIAENMQVRIWPFSGINCGCKINHTFERVILCSHRHNNVCAGQKSLCKSHSKAWRAVDHCEIIVCDSIQ